jgi:dnd system-associated protein 4
MVEEKRRNSVNRSNDFKETIDMLYGGDKCFKTIAELLCFSSYVGLNARNRSPIKSNKKGEPVDLDIFEKASIDRHIWALNIFVEQDKSILLDHNKCIEVFEEYANGGLKIIDEKLKSNPRDTGVETILLMILKINELYFKKGRKKTKKIEF